MGRPPPLPRNKPISRLVLIRVSRGSEPSILTPGRPWLSQLYHYLFFRSLVHLDLNRFFSSLLFV